MLTAPQQDWTAYEKMTRSGDTAWIRGLTPANRFAIYADLFDTIRSSRDPTVNWQRVEDEHWQLKLTQRLAAVDAFRKLDEYRGTTAQRDIS